MRSQAQIYGLIAASGVLDRLAAFDPHWLGSTALDVHVTGSDVDICCTAHGDLNAFEASLRKTFGKEPNFKVKREQYRGKASCLAIFSIADQFVEIYGRAHPVAEHEFYQLFVVEQRLLRFGGEALQGQVRDLKFDDFTTEQAFGRALGLGDDPEAALLELLEAPATDYLSLLSKADFA